MDTISIKKALITGAGGFIGGQLALFLVNKGIHVNAMYRQGSTLSSTLMQHPNITPVPANLLDYHSLVQAGKGCDFVFHLAAYAQPWAKNKQTYYDINVTGTNNVLDAAKINGARRVVVTATAGTFGPQIDDSLINEDIQQIHPPFSEYERTKLISNRNVNTYINQGMDIVIVSPTRVFGPGELSASNAVTKILKRFIYGNYRFMPGNGNTIGNYAYIKDVINGHYLSAIKGRKGENYILGGENLSYREMLIIFGEVVNKKIKPNGIPIPIIMVVSKVMLFFGNTLGITPLITPPFVRKFTHKWATDISKAKNELGYTVTSFKEAIHETLDWIKLNER